MLAARAALPIEREEGDAVSLPRILAGDRRRRVAWLVANGIGQAMAGFALAFALRGLLRGSESGTLDPRELGAMVGLGLFVLALRIREASDAERLGQDYVMRVRLEIFDRLAGRPRPAEKNPRFGVTLSRLTGDLNSLRNWVSYGIARAVVAGVSIVGLVASLFYFSPLAGGVITGVLVVSLLGSALALPSLRLSVREARRRRGRLTNNLSEKVLAARAVWQLGRTEHERSRIRRHSRALRDALVRRARWSALLRSSAEIVWPIAIVSLLAALVATARPASELVVSILLVGMITTALGQIGRALDHRVAYEEGRRRIGAVLAAPRVREARRAVPLPGTAPLDVVFSGVSVDGVFADLSLRAAPGERVLVDGPTGSGKSTLLALLLRHREPDAGEVQLDGIALGQIRLESLRSAVQLVSPELPLLRGNVLENIAGAVADDDDDDWIATVVDACALTHDLALDAGLATRVSEQGANLSEGLRRRIRIARAIAMRPRLLLIDEPGLSADPTASTALANAASLSGATILIVGPDANEQLRIDHVWHLPEGRSERARSFSNVIEGIQWS